MSVDLKITRFVNRKSISVQNSLLKFCISLNILICVNFQIVFAQKIVWKNTIHATQNLEGKQICTDKNNNVYIICNYNYGLKLSPNDSIIDSSKKVVGCLVSYNSKGKFRWALNSSGGLLFNTINNNANYGLNYLNFVSVVSDGNDNITIAGFTGGPLRVGNILIDSNQTFILRIDTAGNIKWVKEFSNSIILQELSPWINKGICFSAMFKGNSANLGGVTLAKGPMNNTGFIATLDSQGNIKWAKPFTSFNMFTDFLCLTSDVSGFIYQDIQISDTSYIDNELCPDSFYYRTYLVKLNPSGNISWLKKTSFYKDFYTSYTIIATDVGGNLYYPVYASKRDIYQNPSLDSTFFYYALVKADSSGKAIWDAQFRYLSWDSFYSFHGVDFQSCEIVVGPDNIIYLSYQNYESGGFSGQAWKCIAAFNQLGHENWIDTLDNIGFDDTSPSSPGNISLTPSVGGVYFTGWSGDGEFPWDDTTLEALSWVDLYTGKIVNTDTTSVINAIQNHQNMSNIMSIYPNPAESYLNLKFTGNEEKIYLITITDITGKQMIVSQYSQSNPIINIENLDPGIYILNLLGEKEIDRIKFVKE